MELTWHRHDGVSDIDAADWNRLAGTDPFVRHEFLTTLEETGCVGEAAGWEPCPITVRDNRQLVGAVPLYLKDNSWGEFVFDFSWANAFHSAGLPYYPKLVTAVPYTPATGPRLLVGDSANARQVKETLVQGLTESARELSSSSVHILFHEEEERELLSNLGFVARKDCQFHWHNQGYSDFDDFLARLSSKKRKQVRRERRRISESGIRFRVLAGDEPNDADWDAIYSCYARTFFRRGRPPYIGLKALQLLGQRLGNAMVLIVAEHSGQTLAAAICFRSETTLYGRYWGSLDDFHSLHFETCYYQGIELCIREGLQRFEPGTQGEHKLSRGFVPVATWSAHWVDSPMFAPAIAKFVRQEAAHIDSYMDQMRRHSPYRMGGSSDQPQ